jgi:hypothetical protein
MFYHHWFNSRRQTCLSFLVGVGLLGVVPSTGQAGLLYQWNFDGGTGANTGSGSGGTLALDVGVVSGPSGYASGSFSDTAGVNGNAFRVSNAYDNYYPGASYSPITNAAAMSNLDLSTVNQFTITMWVKRSGQRNVDLLNIGTSTTPGQGSNPGISVGLDGTWANGVRVGINGHTGYTGDLWSAGTDRDWVFLSISYDGTDTYNVYEDPTMNAIYGRDQNLAITTGTTTSSASVATGMGLHIGDYWTPTGPLSLGSAATMLLGNDGSDTLGATNGFDGLLDDIRIYDGLLTVTQIESIRAEAVPEPACLTLFGLSAMTLRRRRRVI